MKENYLITGASGFVGSCLAHDLVKRGKTVHVISRKQKANWRLKDIEKHIYFHSIDLCDTNLLSLLDHIRPTYVFHLAAYGSLPKENEFKKMIRTNILGTENLIRCLNFTKVKRFINSGTSAEYATTNKPFKESDHVQPMNEYAISKVAQTLFCQKEAIRNNLPIITFRLFSVYGYYEEKTRLIPHTILHAIQNKDIPLANQDFVRDFVFIKDVIDAFLLACTQTIAPGEIFNIGSGKQYTIEEVVKQIILKTGSTSRVQWGRKQKQVRQIEPEVWMADITKAEKMLHWKPTYSLEKGLKKSIAWFTEHQNLYA